MGRLTKAGMELIGMDELDRVLRDLPKKVSKNVQRKAVRAGTSVLLKATRRNVRAIGKVTGTLLKSLTKKVKTYSRTSTVAGIVGPRARAAPHAHLVEYGTDPRYHKSGKSVGRMPILAPFRRAFYSTAPEVKRVMRKKLAEGIKQEALKLRRAG